MKKENVITIGDMRVELFLPGEQVPKEVTMAHPTHGANIAVITSGEENLEDRDVVITESRTLSLGMRTADCAPICLTDGVKIGIAHVGWPGLCLGLIEKVLPYFATENLSVYVAPFLHSFEIKKDFCYDRITKKFEEQFIEQQPGKLVFHFKEAISSLLPPQTVYDSRSTAVDTSFPSYRRDKTKDRFVTVVSFSKP